MMNYSYLNNKDNSGRYAVNHLTEGNKEENTITSLGTSGSSRTTTPGIRINMRRNFHQRNRRDDLQKMISAIIVELRDILAGAARKEIYLKTKKKTRLKGKALQTMMIMITILN